MKGFRFRLQKILDLRLGQEKTAEQELAIATGRCRVVETQIQTLMVSKQTTFRQRASAGNDWSALRSYDLYGARMTLEIEKAEKKLAVLLVEREEKLAAYVEARKKVKVLEKLSEKKFAEFKDDYDKAEAKRTDDLNSAAFIRKMKLVEDAVG